MKSAAEHNAQLISKYEEQIEVTLTSWEYIMAYRYGSSHELVRHLKLVENVLFLNTLWVLLGSQSVNQLMC